jgi:hypothetical protein
MRDCGCSPAANICLQPVYAYTAPPRPLGDAAGAIRQTILKLGELGSTRLSQKQEGSAHQNIAPAGPTPLLHQLALQSLCNGFNLFTV